MMETQRACICIMAGYSSASDMFLEMFSNMSCSAWVSMYVPTKLEMIISIYPIFDISKVWEEQIPGQVQIWSAIKIKFILEHLVNCICRCSLIWDLELGDFLFRSIASAVWCDMGSSSFGMGMMAACLLHVHIRETFDDLIGIDLEIEMLDSRSTT